MPTITHTDYLAQVSGSGLVALPGLWVRLRNNSTNTDYFSTAVSDAQGAFTHSAVPGDYSAYTGTAATVVGTPTLRNAHYAVPVTAGDDAVLGSATLVVSSPYASAPGILPGEWVSAVNPYNIKAYGAKCDGVTNDTNAWYKGDGTGAVEKAAATKGSVVFAGTSVITANIFLNIAPIEIEGLGPGAILKVSGIGFSAISIAAVASGSQGQNFVIDGGAAAPASGSHGINCGSTNDITLLNLEIKNCGAKAVNSGNTCSRWLVDNCRFHDNFDEGLLMDAGSINVIVRGTYAYNNGYNGFDFNASQVMVDSCYAYSNGNKAGVTYSGQVDRGGFIVFAPNGANYNTLSFVNCFAFSNIYHGFHSHTATGGTVQHVTYSNCHAFSNGTAGAVNVADGICLDAQSSGGTMDHHSVIGGSTRGNSRCGVFVAAVPQAVVQGVMSHANGGYTVGTQAGTGILVQDGSAMPLVSGNTVTGHTTQAATGISIFNVAVTDAQVLNNVTPVTSNTTAWVNNGTRSTFAGNKINVTDAIYRFDIGAVAVVDSVVLTKDLRRGGSSPTYVTPYTPDAILSGEVIQMANLTGPITVNAPASSNLRQFLTFIWAQDGTGGRVVTYNAVYKTTGAAAFVTTANTVTIDTFVCIDGTNWRLMSRITGQT